MGNPLVLLVEDETDVMLANQEYLENRGIQTLASDSLSMASSMLQQHPIDLVLLDINLPDGSGLQLLNQIRQQGNIPVILLTCRTQKDDVIQGLEYGGCDYITKPYDLDILYARIQAQLRRHKAEIPSRIDIGNISIDVTRYTAYLDGKDALLKPKEFSLLLYLVRHQQEVVPVDQIYQGVWGGLPLGDTRTVRVHIHSLRKKLDLEQDTGPRIETCPNKGYCFYPE